MAHPYKGSCCTARELASKRYGGGLYENIHAKRERIAEGSGERMRKPGQEGAPTAEAFRESAKTAKSRLDRPERASGGKTPAWTRAEGKNPEGGLNAKGRASYHAETGGTLKPPSKDTDNPRHKSFCARSAGQMKQFPGAAKDPDSRLRKARRAWGC
jgi:hypothetical protein